MESTRSRPPSSQLVYVHVWLLPQPLWKEETNTALAQDTTRAVSVGFVRTLPDWPLLVVRRQVERELDRDVTQQFIFLKGMGPHLVHVNVKQEQHVKVKSIFYSLVPDESPPRPEVIFILPGSALRSPSRPLSLPWGSRQTGRWDVSTPPSREPDNLVVGVVGGGAGAAVPNNRTPPPPPPLTPPSPAMPPPPPLLTPRLELPAPSRHQEAARGGGETAAGNGAAGRTAAGRRGGGGNLAAAVGVGVPTTPATSATLDSGIGGGGGGGLALSVSSRSGDAQMFGKRAVEDAVTFAPTTAAPAVPTAAASHRVRGRISGDEDSDSDDVTSSDSMVLPPPPALRITIAAPAATAEPPPSVTPRRPEVTAPAGTRAKVATPPPPRRANGGGGGGEESAPDDGFPVAPPPPPPPPAFVAGGGRDAGENGGKDAGRYSNKDGGKDGGAQGGGGRHADFTHGAERRGLAGEHGAAGEETDEGRVRQPATEPEPELAAKELSELQDERREMERHRRELVARIKETRAAMHARRAEDLPRNPG
ncbi:arf-GAP with GTPase, ANK repeat and PH domain-containing protein 2-like isoform X2 [Lethenteron reissneri]|uniref:arf-GAP with GTPase, ANK repeat and PH domain-containing protein 2-like isoform X2 n=1 Tax=Lethenteron reissneri TaxID=7753 RepID=UPI002AB64ECD|nr:arf-GAP with GTPase, ANK repeat and PH domain-containing protein 2-like isoform X2 [Lethenteron reissneri]